MTMAARLASRRRIAAVSPSLNNHKCHEVLGPHGAGRFRSWRAFRRIARKLL